MHCNDNARELLHAFVDGQLDSATHHQVEKHLAQCEECARERDALLALHELLQQKMPYHKAPVGLAERIKLAAETPPVLERPKVFRRRAMALAAAAVIFICLCRVYFEFHRAHPEIGTRQQIATIEHDIVALHQQGASQGPLVDLASSDPQTIQRFLAEKLSYKPVVPDLARDGFVLAGARVSHLDRKDVATLIYRHNQHVISFFLWPAGESNYRHERYRAEQSYQLAYWAAGGMHCWLVSDLDAQETKVFAGLLEKSLEPPVTQQPAQS